MEHPRNIGNQNVKYAGNEIGTKKEITIFV